MLEPTGVVVGVVVVVVVGAFQPGIRLYVGRRLWYWQPGRLVAVRIIKEPQPACALRHDMSGPPHPSWLAAAGWVSATVGKWPTGISSSVASTTARSTGTQPLGSLRPHWRGAVAGAVPDGIGCRSLALSGAGAGHHGTGGPVWQAGSAARASVGATGSAGAARPPSVPRGRGRGPPRPPATGLLEPVTVLQPPAKAHWQC